MTPDDREMKCGEAESGPLHEAATKVPEGCAFPVDHAREVPALEARDGTRGTLTDAYGSYADPAVGAAVDRMCVTPFPARHRLRTVLVGAALGACTVAAAVLIRRRRAA